MSQRYREEQDNIDRIQELEEAVSFIYEILRPGLCPQATKACDSCDFEVKQALHKCREVLGIDE